MQSGRLRFEEAVRKSQEVPIDYVNVEEILGTLSVDRGAELLPPHKSIPLASSARSLRPSSPVSGLYNTLAAIANQSFTQQFAGTDMPVPDASPDELKLPTDMQLDQHFLSYAWDASSIWPTDSEILLDDDFDLNAIPAIDIGNGTINDQFVESASVLKFGREFASALEGREYSQENTINFDETMARLRC
jgi:hypothetical protein